MPVPGILSSAAAFTQAQFDQTKREITLNGKNPTGPIRTQGGAGGGPVWTRTVQTLTSAERELATNGSNALRLAPTQFQSTYLGGLLDHRYHLLDAAFGGSNVDFHA